MSFNPSYPYRLEPLPPKNNFKNERISDLLLKARTELAELKGFSFMMPNPLLLTSPAIIKESVASSQIENINTTIVDVLQEQLFPEPERREPDKEVLRYRDAIMWGFNNLNKYSISTRLILGILKLLIPDSNGAYRKQQNQIKNNSTGEILFTPPIAPDIPGLMSNWERFVNEKDTDMDPLIKSIIAHYQFESIHPFDDGNGRAGRILMVLQLIREGLIAWPILYISGYITNNRSDYYKNLRGVNSDQKWNELIVFMLEGFYKQAKETKETLFAVMTLFYDFKHEMKKKHRKIYSADFVEALFSLPIITPVRLAAKLNIHYTTASKHLMQLTKDGTLKERKLGKYHLFINEKLLKLVKA